MDKIKKIYRFLERNRSYAYDVQVGTYKSWLSYYSKPQKRAYALFHHAFYTQSQPKLEKAKDFFKQLDDSSLKSAKAFISKMGGGEEVTYDNLFKIIKDQSGWGSKTAALLIKNLYQINTNPQLRSLKFWNDLPSNIETDHMYLPVDEVIKFIFKKIEPNRKKFDSINKYFKDSGYSFKEIEIWDDLWFWGFITQEIIKGQRIFTDFNEAKYWALLHTDKDIKVIDKIKVKASEFKKLITTK